MMVLWYCRLYYTIVKVHLISSLVLLFFCLNVFGSLSTVVGGISGFGAGLGASIALAQVSPPMAAEAAPWLIGVGTIAGAVGGLVQG